METITATKIPNSPADLSGTDTYEVLIQETRIDEVGNEYPFTRKERIKIKEINKKIDNIDERITLLQEEKTKLRAIKTQLK